MNNIKPILSEWVRNYNNVNYIACPKKSVRELERKHQEALDMIDKMYYHRCDSEYIYTLYAELKAKGEGNE